MFPGSPETRASLILRLPNAADVAAWDEVVAVYGPLIYRMARRQGLQAADADDVVQEVFVLISRSVAKWLERTDRGKFRAWLLRIARNTALNSLMRGTRRHQGIGGDDAAEWLKEIPGDESSVSQEFDFEYRREIFRWAAIQIREVVSETTWQAFWMTHVEQMSIANAAGVLGTSEGNIYVSRSRVMARLQALVTQFDDIS